jgi:hypothetical protein
MIILRSALKGHPNKYIIVRTDKFPFTGVAPEQGFHSVFPERDTVPPFRVCLKR